MKNIDLITFPIHPDVQAIIDEIENYLGQEIEVRHVSLPERRKHAPAEGGFERWEPYIGINKPDEFDLHSVAHELLHIRRLMYGAYIPTTVPNSTPVVKNFAEDVFNEFEHIVIFPELVDLGFDPHELGNQWVRRKIEELGPKPSADLGKFQRARVAMNLATMHWVANDEEAKKEFFELMRKKDERITNLSKRIRSILQKKGLDTNEQQVSTYTSFCEVCKIPPGLIFLKQLDCKNRQVIQRQLNYRL